MSEVGRLATALISAESAVDTLILLFNEDKHTHEMCILLGGALQEGK